MVDTGDAIADATPGNPKGSCERVIRKKPGPREDRAENKTQSPGEERREQ